MRGRRPLDPQELIAHHEFVADAELHGRLDAQEDAVASLEVVKPEMPVAYRIAPSRGWQKRSPGNTIAPAEPMTASASLSS